MQGLLRPLIICADIVALSPIAAWGQVVVVCPGEPVVFQLAGEYYGSKTWEYSADGIAWTPVQVTENEPVSLQPDQAGWYRVRFWDADCDTAYVSDPVHFALPKIDLGAAMTLNIVGQVMDEDGLPVMGATVRVGCGSGVTTTTDYHGVFLLEGAQAYEELAYVTVEKEGFFPGSRSFVPAQNAESTWSQVRITLLRKNVAGFVNASNGWTVSLEDVTLSFPPNAFVKDGQPFAGLVYVAVNHIDPTTDSLHQQMPGMLLGVQEDEPQLLLSYGMIGVELTDDTGERVELAPGSLATVRYPVMPDQQANAPEVMPLWWFDEALGYWVREGEAQLEGDEYVGQVAHFSWWNVDVPGAFVLLRGAVLDQSNGSTLSNAQVRLISSTMGTGTVMTDGQGGFTGMVPIGQELTLQVWYPCGLNGTLVMVHEEVVGPFASTSEVMVEVNIPAQSLVVGQVLTCIGSPVEQGYVWVGGHAVFCTDGTYQFQTCSDSITIRGVDMLAGTVSENVGIAVTSDTTFVPDLTTCIQTNGSVTDIDGNVYPTVLIGNLEWMASNLRTTRYRDGTLIPNVTVDNQWMVFYSGAWSNIWNNTANDSIYGKLYNWYVASDPNVCPLGWHVPTDDEWKEMEIALGMPLNQVDTLLMRGVEQNVGGKLKAAALWDLPNAGATDQTGFSGYGGGVRSWYGGGYFGYLGTHAFWWTSSPAPPSQAWARYLSTYSPGIYREKYNRTVGAYIRCIRD